MILTSDLLRSGKNQTFCEVINEDHVIFMTLNAGLW